MTTATAITDKKRTKALKAFLLALRDAYNVKPLFAHVDKDFAEIRACRNTWPDVTIQVCWWHIRDAL